MMIKEGGEPVTNKGLKILSVAFISALTVYGAGMVLDTPLAYSATISDTVAGAVSENTKPPVKPASPVVEAPVKTGDLPLPIPAPKAETSTVTVAKETAIGLKVFDKAVDLAGTPIVVSKDGKTVLPLRKLGEAMGYIVKWDDTIKGALLQKGTETITVKIDSLDYSWGSVPRKLSKKIEMYKNRMYVSLDFITSNQGLRLNQTKDMVVIELADAEAKSALTGVIEEVTLYSNGLGLKVLDKTAETTLYVSEETKITDYSTGDTMDKSSLKVGTKAIFSYSVVIGDEKKNYNLLRSVEVVSETEQKKKP